jgi:hypothetical protein
VTAEAAGLAPGAISPFCVKRAAERSDGFARRHGRRWASGVDLDQRVVPAKRGGAEWRIAGVRPQRRQEFPTPLYGRRSLMASRTSSATRQRSARAPGRAPQPPCLPALVRGIADDILRLWRFTWPHVLRMQRSHPTSRYGYGTRPHIGIDHSVVPRGTGDLGMLAAIGYTG